MRPNPRSEPKPASKPKFFNKRVRTADPSEVDGATAGGGGPHGGGHSVPSARSPGQPAQAQARGQALRLATVAPELQAAWDA